MQYSLSNIFRYFSEPYSDSGTITSLLQSTITSICRLQRLTPQTLCTSMTLRNIKNRWKQTFFTVPYQDWVQVLYPPLPSASLFVTFQYTTSHRLASWRGHPSPPPGLHHHVYMWVEPRERDMVANCLFPPKYVGEAALFPLPCYFAVRWCKPSTSTIGLSASSLASVSAASDPNVSSSYISATSTHMPAPTLVLQSSRRSPARAVGFIWSGVARPLLFSSSSRMCINWYRCFYQHRSRDSVSTVWGIFTNSAPLGRVGHRVAMSGCGSAPSGAVFF